MFAPPLITTVRERPNPGNRSCGQREGASLTAPGVIRRVEVRAHRHNDRSRKVATDYPRGHLIPDVDGIWSEPYGPRRHSVGKGKDNCVRGSRDRRGYVNKRTSPTSPSST